MLPQKPPQCFLDYIDTLKCDPEQGLLYGRRGYSIGSMNPKGYVRVPLTVNGQRINFALSHIIWYKAKGTWPTLQIDHDNRIRHDDRIGNLKEVTYVENAENSGHSVYRDLPAGVAHSLTPGKFVAFKNTWVDGDKHKLHLGTFDTLEEAIHARTTATAADRTIRAESTKLDLPDPRI